jgi:hypothetical protein
MIIYILGSTTPLVSLAQFLYARRARWILSVPPLERMPIDSFSYPKSSPVILMTSASIYLVAGN